MDLSLLYEFDLPRPWEGEHPWGQRMAERKAYQESIEQLPELKKARADRTAKALERGLTTARESALAGSPVVPD